MLPRYYSWLGRTRRFPGFSLGFPWKGAESLSQLGTVWSASLGVLPSVRHPGRVQRQVVGPQEGDPRGEEEQGEEEQPQETPAGRSLLP